MTDQPLPLTDLPDPEPPLPDGLSAGQRLTLRQAADVAAGIHPLRGGVLHPDAPSDAKAGDRGRPFTCGTCGHRETAYRWPKCMEPTSPRSRGQATDCRGWWPACPAYTPKAAT